MSQIQRGIVWMLGSAISIPIVFVALNGMLAVDAHFERAPNQGAMLVAGALFLLWCVAAGIAIVLGMLMSLIAYGRKRLENDLRVMDHAPKPAPNDGSETQG